MTRTIPVLNERAQVRVAAARWRAQYPESLKLKDGGRTEVIYARLAALDPETATAAEVAAIVGNQSWACPQTCNQCGEASWDVVLLGEEPDYESRTAMVCRRCLRDALKALDDSERA